MTWRGSVGDSWDDEITGAGGSDEGRVGRGPESSRFSVVSRSRRKIVMTFIRISAETNAPTSDIRRPLLDLDHKVLKREVRRFRLPVSGLGSGAMNLSSSIQILQLLISEESSTACILVLVSCKS
jgi:hypothetical protein